MIWEKLGLVYHPIERNWWMQQFAMLPTPINIDLDTIRVFLGFCDSGMTGRVGFIDLSSKRPTEILRVCDKPCLDIGSKGNFDENGVVPVSIIAEEDYLQLYYVGFQKSEHKLGYTMFTGVARSKDGGESFVRLKSTPILSPTIDQFLARCGTFVLRDDGHYKMWYIGTLGTGWTTSESGKTLPVYTMFYQESENGLDWDKTHSKQCMSFESTDEHGFGRPFVWKTEDGYIMLFSIRYLSSGYRIGYARSENGVDWVREDLKAGIFPSDSGWDSHSVAYPTLIETGNKTYVFYNGNNSGKTGFGVSRLVKW